MNGSSTRGSASAVNNSTWAFAAIEACHLLALAALGGAILVVDLRLLGFGLKEERISYVGQTAQPWLLGGLAAAIVTGIPLLASLAAGKYYVNEAFWMKMYFFLAALIFTFTIRRAVVLGDEVRANSQHRQGGRDRLGVALVRRGDYGQGNWILLMIHRSPRQLFQQRDDPRTV